LPFDQVGSECGQPIKLTLRPAEFDRHVAAFDKASFVQASANCGHVFGIGRRRRWRSQDANNRHQLLSARCERPCGRASEKGDELAALHHEEFPAAYPANGQLVGTEN
jgi:hypothetical protein